MIAQLWFRDQLTSALTHLSEYVLASTPSRFPIYLHAHPRIMYSISHFCHTICAVQGLKIWYCFYLHLLLESLCCQYVCRNLFSFTYYLFLACLNNFNIIFRLIFSSSTVPAATLCHYQLSRLDYGVIHKMTIIIVVYLNEPLLLPWQLKPEEHKWFCIRRRSQQWRHPLFYFVVGTAFLMSSWFLLLLHRHL